MKDIKSNNLHYMDSISESSDVCIYWIREKVSSYFLIQNY